MFYLKLNLTRHILLSLFIVSVYQCSLYFSLVLINRVVFSSALCVMWNEWTVFVYIFYLCYESQSRMSASRVLICVYAQFVKHSLVSKDLLELMSEEMWGTLTGPCSLMLKPIFLSFVRKIGTFLQVL